MNEAEAIAALPPGFEPMAPRSEFSRHNGPFFHRPGGEHVEHAFFVLPRHTNALGVLHGGMLSAFLDSLLGAAVHRATGRTGVTVHLSVDFVRMARRGECLIGEGRLTQAARDVAFAEGGVRAGRRLVGRATGVFKLMGR